MNKEVINLILTTMRKEITDHGGFLSRLKTQAKSLRQNASIQTISKEIGGIENVLKSKDHGYSISEIQEFQAILESLKKLLKEKSENHK